MASISDQQYPDHLNPFGSEDEDATNKSSASQVPCASEYPEHLDPFQELEDKADDLEESHPPTDTYDSSLNPFGNECEEEATKDELGSSLKVSVKSEQTKEVSTSTSPTSGNPFEESEDEPEKSEDITNNSISLGSTKIDNGPDDSTPQVSLEPPKPLPRTKSLLKKELILKNKQRQQMQPQTQQNSQDQVTSFSSAASSTSSSSTTTTVNNPNVNATVGSFNRRKNKRNAPPVPVNFKRQVSGSFSAIEDELENIGDMLAIIEKESSLCQEDLKANYNEDKTQFATSQAKLIELIKRKGSIVRRQRELMYKKRELNLDQLHSDIEYELRMIGNKQRKYSLRHLVD